MKISVDSKKIEELLSRGVEEIVDKDHLRKKLISGEKLRIKHGVDPTGPKIHLGRATQFWKLKGFQDLGHQIVLIIGDFTARIGDASDKESMRKPLTDKEIKENMKGYLSQIGKILDIKETEVRHNSEWLGKLSARDLIELSMNFTAQQMIQRRNFKERWDQGKPIGLHELAYPVFQGYDSVVVKSDVELGGFDQLFNLKTGRDLQKVNGQIPQDIITLKMLFGLDGRKMSTSWGNVVNISDDPKEMYGKLMSMKDESILSYFELCTKISLEEIEKMKKKMEDKTVNPKELKEKLAREIVSMYCGEKEADSAGKEFGQVFKDKKNPSEIAQIEIKEKSLNVLELLVKLKLASSKSEAKRLILQKGVKLGGMTQESWQEMINIEKGMIVQSGKRKFAKIS